MGLFDVSVKVTRPPRWAAGADPAAPVGPATDRTRRAAGDLAVNTVRRHIDQTQTTATRNLWHSVTALHRQGLTGQVQTEIRMAEYGVYASEGTAPHFPNLERLAAWAAVVGIPARAVYAVAVWISQHGTRGSGFLRDAVAEVQQRAVQLRDSLRDEIVKLLGGD